MERITQAQIKQFIDPRSFAISRADSTVVSETDRSSRLITDNVNDSFSLITGSISRMDQLFFNLNTMRELAVEGSRGNLSDRKYDEVYGKLRSLTAGFDQVVEDSVFNDRPLLDGRSLVLDIGAGSINIDMANIRLSGEDSLDLIKRSEGAQIDITFEPATVIRNQGTGLTGLDISDAVGIPVADGKTELEDGKYNLEVEYYGNASTLYLRDQYGGILEQVDNVDLSGTGTEIIRFDSGVQVTVDKLQLLQTYDKYDFENDGSVSLFADLEYNSVYYHELQDGEKPFNTTSNVDFVYKPPRAYGDDRFNLLSAETDGLGELGLELKNGSYNVQITHNGADSLIEMKDSNGRLIARKSGIDLSAEGTHNIDMGVGVRFSVESKGTTTSGKTINAVFNYERAVEYDRDFDFESYVNKIDGAMQALNEQLYVMEEAQNRILEIRDIQQSGVANMTFSAASLLSGVAGSTGLFSILNSNQATLQLSATANQLFATTSGALASQGGITATNVLLL